MSTIKGGHDVSVRSRGNSEFVFNDLKEQFMAFGTSRIITENLAQALVDDALERTDEFRGRVQQNYIGVSAVVAEQFQEDIYQFETGHIRVAGIRGYGAFR